MDRKQHAHLVDDVLEYILKRVEKKDGCWNWIGPLNSNKAPRFNKFVLGKKTHLSPHIVMYNRRHFPDTASDVAYPKDEIRRKCGNILCVSPEHLLRGTRTKTIQAMKERGTTQTGNDNHLLHDHVQIVKDREAGMTYSEIAEKHGLSGKGHVSWILKQSLHSKEKGAITSGGEEEVGTGVPKYHD